MNTNLTTNNTAANSSLNMNSFISSLIQSGKLVDCHAIYADANHSRVLLKIGNTVYLHNTMTHRAYAYTVDADANVIGFKQTTLAKYNAQCAAVKAKLAAEKLQESKVASEPKSEAGKGLLEEALSNAGVEPAKKTEPDDDMPWEDARAERERIEAWKKSHGEVAESQKHTAVLLDAEREDSTFDYRNAEDILSQSEVESYEEKDSLLDEEKTDLRGFHKGMLIRWENVKGKVTTAKDGSQIFHKPYVLLTFLVEGQEVPSRAYAAQFESFKRQANPRNHYIFSYTKDSVALNEMLNQTFDLWLSWNEMLGHMENGKWIKGEWQAEFYDKEAYKARKAKEARVSELACRGAYGRPTENKATR